MKKLVCLLGLLMIVGFSASAQDMNKVDIFGGYTYLRLSSGGSSSSINMNGVVGSLAYNLTNHVAAVGEFGGYFGSVDGANIHSQSYLFGPKIYAHMGKITPFGQFLLGGVHASASCSECENVSDSAFGMALG